MKVALFLTTLWAALTSAYLRTLDSRLDILVFLELLFKIADTLETDPNTILGVKNNVASVDEALNELPLEMKSKLSVLFRAMINQIKEQDVIN